MQDDALREVLTPARVRQMALLQLIRMSYLQKVAKQYGVSLSSTPVEHVAASEIPDEELHNVGFESRGFQDALHAGQLSRSVGEHVFPTVTVPEERMHAYFTEHPDLFEASWEASAQLAFFRGYIMDLIAAVQKAAAEGASLDEMKKVLGDQLASKYEQGMSKYPAGRYRDSIGMNVEMVYQKVVKKG